MLMYLYYTWHKMNVFQIHFSIFIFHHVKIYLTKLFGKKCKVQAGFIVLSHIKQLIPSTTM